MKVKAEIWKEWTERTKFVARSAALSDSWEAGFMLRVWLCAYDSPRSSTEYKNLQRINNSMEAASVHSYFEIYAT